MVLSSFRNNEGARLGDELTEEDVIALLNGAAYAPTSNVYIHKRDFTILLMLSMIGPRSNQVAMLTVHDIGIDDEVLTISLTRQKEARKAIESSYDVKKISKEASLYGYVLYDAVDEYMDARMDVPAPTDALFLSRYSMPLSRRSVSSLVSRCGATLGKTLCVHSFRRFVANRLSNERGIHVAQRVLGHKSVTTTERYVTQEVVL
jgi:integrase